MSADEYTSVFDNKKHLQVANEECGEDDEEEEEEGKEKEEEDIEGEDEDDEDDDDGYSKIKSLIEKKQRKQ